MEADLAAALARANKTEPAPAHLSPTLQAVWHLLRETGERIDVDSAQRGDANTCVSFAFEESFDMPCTCPPQAWQADGGCSACGSSGFIRKWKAARDAMLVWADARQAKGDPLGLLVALSLDPATVDSITPDMACEVERRALSFKLPPASYSEIQLRLQPGEHFEVHHSDEHSVIGEGVRPVLRARVGASA